VHHTQLHAQTPLQHLIRATHGMWLGPQSARCRSEESIAGAFDAAVEHFGALHGAVLAAGIVNRSHRTPLSDITAQDFDDTCTVNLLAASCVSNTLPGKAAGLP
jgi:NAD(P)-dependent dehydrogenase (short-subunit alcohol dehydrogenase family)